MPLLQLLQYLLNLLLRRQLRQHQLHQHPSHQHRLTQRQLLNHQTQIKEMVAPLRLMLLKQPRVLSLLMRPSPQLQLLKENGRDKVSQSVAESLPTSLILCSIIYVILPVHGKLKSFYDPFLRCLPWCTFCYPYSNTLRNPMDIHRTTLNSKPLTNQLHRSATFCDIRFDRMHEPASPFD